VFVCSQDPAAAKKGLRKWWAKPFFTLWGLKCRRKAWAKERVQFLEYFRDSIATPDTIDPKADEARTMSAPFHWRLLAMLMCDFHMTEAEALSKPIAWATCMWAVEGERQGKVDLPSKEARDFRAAVDAMEKEAANGTC
jgi:hypothetical protein